MAQVEVLLQELEALPHAARVKRMVELGRSSLTEHSTGNVLRALQSQQGVFAQSLACYACYGTRDASFCRGILGTSGSKTLKGLAMSVLLDIIPDEEVPQVVMPLATNPAHSGQLLRMVTKLRKQGRLTACAHVVHAVTCFVDPTAKVSGPGSDGVPVVTNIDHKNMSKAQLKLLAGMVPYGNTQQVAVLLHIFIHWCDWRLVAQYHPQPVLDELAAVPESHRCKYLVACLDPVMQHAPEQVYELFKTLSVENVSPALAARLYARFPERMLDHFMQMQSDDQAQHLQPWLARAAAVKQQQQQKQQEKAAAGMLARQVSAVSIASSWAAVPSEDGSTADTTMEGFVEVMPETAANTDTAGGDETAPDAAAVAEQSVYSTLARKPLYGMSSSPYWASISSVASSPGSTVKGMLPQLARCRVRDLKRMPIQAVLQICLQGFCVPKKVLRSLPVTCRVEFYNAWKDWWKQQRAALKQLEDGLASNGQAATAASYLKSLRQTTQDLATSVWTSSDLHKLLPAATLEDLARVLLSEFDYDRVTSVLRAAVPHLEPSVLHKLLRDYPKLWYNESESTGSVSYQMYLHLPATLHADLLQSHPLIASARNQHAIWAAEKPCSEVVARMLPVFQGQWEAGCKLAALGASTATTATTPVTTDGMDAQLKVLLAYSKTAQLKALLESLPIEALQAVLERTCSSQASPFVACSSVYSQLRLLPPTLEVMYQHWQSVIAAPEHDVEHLCGSTLTSLAGSRDGPQHLKYQAVKATLQIMEDIQLYAPWLLKLGSIGASEFKAYLTHVYTAPSGKWRAGQTQADPRVLMWALSPLSRQALVLHAAQRALALCPGVATNVKAAQHLGSGRVLQQLCDHPQHILQGWTAEGAKQLLELMPGLLHQVPLLLVYLNTSDAQQQLQKWHANRQTLEQCMVQMLNGADAAGGDTTTQLAALGPAAIQALSPSIRSMLAIQSDPLLQQLIGKDELLRKLMAAAGQGTRGTLCQAVFDMVRPVIWHEWNNGSRVLLGLLPPTERAVLARASIMEVTAQHKGALSALFDKIKQLIPYLPYTEIIELPCFKEKYQARDADTRAQAMEFIVLAVPLNPDLLRPVLQLLHVRRREPDDIRKRVLTALNNKTVLEALSKLATSAAVKERTAEHALSIAQEYVKRDCASLGVDEAGLAQQAADQYLAAVKDTTVNPPGADDSWKLACLKSSLPGLAQLIKDCAASHDLSSTSSALLADLILMLLPSEPAWATQQLATLMSHTGFQGLGTHELKAAGQVYMDALQAQAKLVAEHAQSVVAASNRSASRIDRAAQMETDVDADQDMDAATRQTDAESAVNAKRHVRGRRRRAAVQFNASRVRPLKGMHTLPKKIQPTARTIAPTKHQQAVRWLLPELWLEQFISQTIPALIQAVLPRQDGLVCALHLLKMAHGQVVHLLRQSQQDGHSSDGAAFLNNPEMVATLDVAVRQLVTSTPLLEPIASLDAGPATVPVESMKLVAWYADKVLLYMPDEYAKLLHLMFPADVRHYEVLKPRLLNTLQDSLPKDRYDLLLPFLFNNKHLPELATKAVTYLFKYHPDKVSSTIPKLLSADPSYIMIPRVFWYCVNHHQQLVPALDIQDNSSMATDTAPTGGSTAPAASGEDAAQQPPTLLFMKGASGASLRTGIKGRNLKSGSTAPSKTRYRSYRKRPSRMKFNYSGWSRQGLHTSLWLGLPQLSLRTAYKLSTSQQEAIGKVLTAAFKTQGKLDVTVVRGLANRLAALPALPPSCLLDLLKTDGSSAPAEADAASQPGAAQQAGQQKAAAAGKKAAAAAADGSSQAVHDVVLASLVKLDDMSQAWSSLITALRSGGSSTALAAISALLAADIRALTSAQAAAPGTPATSVSESGAAAALLQKMRQLPWTRAAVMCEVIKLLGQLAHKSPAALNELMTIADYAAAGLKKAGAAEQASTPAGLKRANAGDQGDAAAGSKRAHVAQPGTTGQQAGKAAPGFPLPAGKPLHRSPHIQLLKTLQAFYGDAKVKTAFLTATGAEDTEIASAAAFIPDEALRRATPDVIPTCVEVFSSLIKHPDQLVRLHAINTWSDSDSIIPLDSALSLVQQVTTWINTAKAPAAGTTPEEKDRLAHEANEAKKALQRWFTRLV